MCIIVGIYKIENNVNGKMYIGQTRNIEERWDEHLYLLKNNRHSNNHLQNSWNKYGKNNFNFEVIKECNVEELNKEEIYYIGYFKTHNGKYGYNKTYGGEGSIPTEETREKMSAWQRGRKLSKEHCENVSRGQKGKTISIETRKAMSDGRKGTKHSEETLAKMSKSAKGHSVSEDSRRKIGEGNKGKIISSETRKNMSESKKGEKHKGSKITESQVLIIIGLLLKGEGIVEISKKLDISKNSIQGIKYHQIWKHMTEGITFPKKTYSNSII